MARHPVRNPRSRVLWAVLVAVWALLLVGVVVARPAVAQVEGPTPGPPAVVGDSLTVGAMAYLPLTWQVDALNGRMLHESVGLLGTGPRRSARCIVVALGSNDVSRHRSESQMIRDIEWGSRLVVNHPCVLWTTVKVDGVSRLYGAGWRRYARQWNALLRTHATGQILDWNAVARQHPEYFLGDGLHMKNAGRAAYARLLRAGVRAGLATP